MVAVSTSSRMAPRSGPSGTIFSSCASTMKDAVWNIVNGICSEVYSDQLLLNNSIFCDNTIHQGLLQIVSSKDKMKKRTFASVLNASIAVAKIDAVERMYSWWSHKLMLFSGKRL